MKKFIPVLVLSALTAVPAMAQTAAPPAAGSAAQAAAGPQLPPPVVQLGDAVSRQLNDSGLAAAATHNIPTDGQDVLDKWRTMQEWVTNEVQQLDAAKKDRDRLQTENMQLRQQLDQAKVGAVRPQRGPQSYPQSSPR